MLREVAAFRCALTRALTRRRPTAAAIIEELNALRKEPREDELVVQRSVQLLEMLPDIITDGERASILIPGVGGNLVPFSAGICYYNGGGDSDIKNRGEAIAHPLVTENLAQKLGLNPLGLEAEDNFELGEKPITTIRNTLKRYDPKQFFTEFIANATDAKATQFKLLIDDYEGPRNNLLSERMKDFQGASLVVYNNGVFTQDDFRGIRETGIGAKRGKPGMIGHFGLGALSMFHFTEVRWTP